MRIMLSSSVTIRKRERNVCTSTGVNRRISCKDLGHGDCQGWLYKRSTKSSKFGQNWTKYWFILKEKSLYYYKKQEDETAKGVIHLPGFQVKQAPEASKKL